MTKDDQNVQVLYSLDHFSKFNDLRFLILSNCNLSHVSFLQYCQKLEFLDVSNNQITTFGNATVWKNLNSLTMLYASANAITTFEAIHALKFTNTIKYLCLTQNLITFHPYYRHFVINSIFSLLALDSFVIADQEIIEYLAEDKNYSIDYNKYFIDSTFLKEELNCVSKIEKFIKNFYQKINYILAHNSPIIIIQRYFRGYLIRKKLNMFKFKKTEKRCKFTNLKSPKISSNEKIFKLLYPHATSHQYSRNTMIKNPDLFGKTNQATQKYHVDSTSLTKPIKSLRLKDVNTEIEETRPKRMAINGLKLKLDKTDNYENLLFNKFDTHNHIAAFKYKNCRKYTRKLIDIKYGKIYSSKSASIKFKTNEWKSPQIKEKNVQIDIHSMFSFELLRREQSKLSTKQIYREKNTQKRLPERLKSNTSYHPATRTSMRSVMDYTENNVNTPQNDLKISPLNIEHYVSRSVSANPKNESKFTKHYPNFNKFNITQLFSSSLGHFELMKNMDTISQLSGKIENQKIINLLNERECIQRYRDQVLRNKKQQMKTNDIKKFETIFSCQNVALLNSLKPQENKFILSLHKQNSKLKKKSPLKICSKIKPIQSAQCLHRKKYTPTRILINN
ncbi:hypothetical protein A3Q56_05114 [Intoshia linei]|uniref:Uncharacterized protein n=1 Tax=Intoshia linei TaxID=1819745 RepID=A0A177AYS5_9BILA|nr:hypothetical protein A3Q56_05114 [Intoshia linei]